MSHDVTYRERTGWMPKGQAGRQELFVDMERDSKVADWT